MEDHLTGQTQTVILPMLASESIVGTLGMSAGSLDHSEAALKKPHQITHSIEQNLTRIPTVIKKPNNQLNSLSEVVLHDRRGLSLLFMEQGGQCAALGKDCCFYANSTMAIIEKLEKLEREAKEWKKLYCDTKGRYEKLLNHNPGLDSIPVEITGPILNIIVVLSFGSSLIK